MYDDNPSRFGDTIFGYFGRIYFVDFLKGLLEAALTLILFLVVLIVLSVVIRTINSIYQRYRYRNWTSEFYPALKQELKEIWLCLFPSYSLSRDKTKPYSKKTIITGRIANFLALFALLFGIVPNTSMGSEELGHIFEKSNYTSYSYALLYTDGDMERPYRVIAEVDQKSGMYYIESVHFASGEERYVEDAWFHRFDYYAAYHNLILPCVVEDYTGAKIQYLNQKPDREAMKSYGLGDI